ncbi:hypothetical protein F2P56_011891 [Juglans regia]|uniref:Laccase n=1 Tax=Juglans regia TaxID=51240 RepID=A0A833XKR2_JUGRE|nr:hypothetical protein F2P56_011891 [Juglans regia]
MTNAKLKLLDRPGQSSKLKETNFTRLCEEKTILTVNGMFPGPTIRVRKGDRAFVNVHNHADYGVTIHWHGVKQPRNPWSDGPENITQCPIKPGKNFTYEVIFSDEEGTLWWHAHSNWTRATVHGAIIIYPDVGVTPNYTYNAEEVIILGDWYKENLTTLVNAAAAVGIDPNVSDSYTINGQPGYPNNCSTETTYALPVQEGNTYLLRIVNAVMNTEMFFGIAKHNLTVVGQDGAYTSKFDTSYIMITPGQTMDVLLTANQSPADNYYMAASSFAASDAPYDETNTSALVVYNNSPSSILYPQLPLPNNTNAAISFTSQIKNSESVNLQEGFDERIIITVSANQLPCDLDKCDGPQGNKLSTSLNNVSYVSTSIDILQAYTRGLLGTYEELPHNPPFPGTNWTNIERDDPEYIFPSQGTKVLTIDYGKSIEIVYQGTSIGNPENHPLHLHGYSFYVVGTASGNFTEEAYKENLNLDNPPKVNTVGVPKSGWIAIRFVANNPGVWFMHCHFERHVTLGMATVLIVRNGTTEETSLLPPPVGLPECS